MVGQLQIPPQVREVTLSKQNKKATRQTMKIMWELARFGSKLPEIITLSRELVYHIPTEQNKNNYTLEVKAVYEFVKNNIRYTRDILDIETLQSAEVTLNYRSGDCDDHAILSGALLLSLGHPIQFVAVALKNQNWERFCHVFVETRIGRTWVALDTTIPEKPMGWIHPDSIRLVSN